MKVIDMVSIDKKRFPFDFDDISTFFHPLLWTSFTRPEFLLSYNNLIFL
jgi:hypothetical protein